MKTRPKKSKTVPDSAKKKRAADLAAATPAKLQIATTASSFIVGGSVSHPQFGKGVITTIEGDKLPIEFADGRVKQIVDYYVKSLASPAFSRGVGASGL